MYTHAVPFHLLSSATHTTTCPKLRVWLLLNTKISEHFYTFTRFYKNLRWNSAAQYDDAWKTTAYLQLRLLIGEFPSLSLQGKKSRCLMTVREREARIGQTCTFAGVGGGFGQVRLDAGWNTMPSCHLWKSPDVHSNKKESRARFRNKKKKRNRNPRCNIWN